MPNYRQSSKTRIDAALNHHPLVPVPRGELWLGSDLFQREGLADTLENHFRLAERLGQEIVCLPVSGDLAHVPMLGYRYFAVGDLVHLPHHGDSCVAVVVDGPFQALVNRQGLMEVLMDWVGQRQELVDAYRLQAAQTIELIENCLARGIQGVVIADDLSADRGPLISPADIQTLGDTFYREAIGLIHAAGATAFVHCCGNIHPLIPLYRAWGVDGLAAVQHHANDLVELRRAWGRPLVIMAGIDAELLERDPPQPAALTSFERLVPALATGGGWIIGSACGLYRGDFLPRLKKLYARVDDLVKTGVIAT